MVIAAIITSGLVATMYLSLRFADKIIRYENESEQREHEDIESRDQEAIAAKKASIKAKREQLERMRKSFFTEKTADGSGLATAKIDLQLLALADEEAKLWCHK
jgi:hypothetical protein